MTRFSGEANDNMDLQQFDSTIKSALENLKVPYEPGSWDLLSKRLDAMPAPDAVDKAIRPVLERVETPYDAGSWATLARRMDGLERARRVRWIKLSEAAIFLLLLLNLKGFFGVVESIHPPAAPTAPKENNLSPIASKQRSHAAISSKNSNDPARSFVAEITAVTTQIAAELRDFIAPADAAPPVSNQSLVIHSSAASLLDPTRFYSHTGILKFTPENKLPVQPAAAIQYASAQYPAPSFTKPAQPVRSNFYAASFASFEQNKINDGNFSDKQQAYGGGMAIGYRKGKWGVEAGVAYSPKSYQPRRENVEYFNDPFQGIAFYHINQVEADVFSLPVKVTRRLAKVGNTSAHAVAGISTHVATSKGYRYKTVLYEPPTPVPGPPLNPPSVADFPTGKGLLENGGTSQNIYASADIGLRVEQSLGKRYTAFVEPVYRKSFAGGLGPHDASINTFAIQAGVMTRL